MQAAKAMQHPWHPATRPSACMHMQLCPAGSRLPGVITARGRHWRQQLGRRHRAAVVQASYSSSSEESEAERVQRIRSEVTRRIKEHGQRGRMKAAIQELAGLAKVGVQPDVQAATALVRACCKDMEIAESIFAELFGDFLEPDEVTFAVLLRGYGVKNPPDWVSMDRVLSDMRVKFNLEPTAVSYNVLLEVCARANDLERGEDVVDRMESDGVQADEYTEACVASRRSLRSYVRKKLL